MLAELADKAASVSMNSARSALPARRRARIEAFDDRRETRRCRSALVAPVRGGQFDRFMMNVGIVICGHPIIAVSVIRRKCRGPGGIAR